jgi:hypothetical protein
MRMIKRLFSRDRTSPEATLAQLQTAQVIVQDYADFLETSAPLPGRIADVSQLPHDKQLIKDAIAVCITGFADPVLSEHLRHGYLMLSAWQQGVGDNVIGVDYSELDLDTDPIILAEQIQKTSNTMGPWQKLVEAEQKYLNAELKEMGAFSAVEQPRAG